MLMLAWDLHRWFWCSTWMVKKLVVNCTRPTVKCLVSLQNYKYLNARLEKNALKLTARTLLLIKAHWNHSSFPGTAPQNWMLRTPLRVEVKGVLLAKWSRAIEKSECHAVLSFARYLDICACVTLYKTSYLLIFTHWQPARLSSDFTHW